MHVQQIISTHPHVRGKTNDALIRCIEECYDCAQSCTACADACLGEQQVHQLTQCIRLDLDCADVCAATGAVASRRAGSNEEVIRQTARRPAASVAMNATSTPAITSIAGSAPRPAAAASRPAPMRSGAWRGTEQHHERVIAAGVGRAHLTLPNWEA